MTLGFPFGFGVASTVYLLLYLVTWVAHFFLAAATLGGAFVAASALLRGRNQLADDIGSALPLLLGLAITAGVAPILFVQVLYGHAFYTANLLLYVRFLAIIPALLACFYLFYFARSVRAKAMSVRARALVYLGSGLLAVFIALSWVELHSLSLASERWIDLYAAGSHGNLTGPVLLRAAMFISLAAPITATTALALSRFHGRPASAAAPAAPFAAIGSLAALAFAGLYARSLSAPVTDALSTGSAGVHLVVFVAAMVASAGIWAAAAARGEISATMRTVIYGLSIVSLWSLAVVREAMRAVRLDLATLEASHARLFESGGKIAFVAFALINGAAIAWCARLSWRVWRDSRES